METLFEKPWEYTFLKNDEDELLLSVICGMIGVFEIVIRLNEEEIAEYKKKGEPYIDQLAKQIIYSPKDWLSRKIN